MSTLAIPMPPRPVQTVTPEELLRMPDAKDFELVDGKLVKRHGSRESSRVALRIGRLLAGECDRTGEATVYASDLGYQCFPWKPGQIRKPDVSLVRKERLSALQGDGGYMPMPADLVVEVVSPNDLYYEVAAKVAEYLEAGFGAVWVVDPQLKQVRVERADGTRTLKGDDEITGGPALPGFRCKVAEFFEA